MSTPIAKAKLALECYSHWAEAPEGGTTENEDRLASALEELLGERNRLEHALREILEKTFAFEGKHKQTPPRLALAEIQRLADDAVCRRHGSEAPPSV